MTLAQLLEQFPREDLALTPTPLDTLDNLSDQLGTRVFLKREDLTGLALGGDKPRKLEYELAQARQAGATTLVTCGSMQSNHARLTTAAARKLGMDCTVVLSRDAYDAFQGNLLTVHVLGADVRVVETADHWDLESHALDICDELQSAGRTPHYIPLSGTTPHSCLGYVRAGLELAAQLRASTVSPDAVYLPFGTGGIFTAMTLALRSEGVHCPIIGISVNRDAATCHANVQHWWRQLNELLGTDVDPPRDIEIHDEFIGAEYGAPTGAGLDAIMLVARTEGILLDPVYSGKMFSGFLAHHTAGRWNSAHRVVLLHSGGVPALFAYHDAIKARLDEYTRVVGDTQS